MDLLTMKTDTINNGDRIRIQSTDKTLHGLTGTVDSPVIRYTMMKYCPHGNEPYYVQVRLDKSIPKPGVRVKGHSINRTGVCLHELILLDPTPSEVGGTEPDLTDEVPIRDSQKFVEPSRGIDIGINRL